MNMQLNRLPGGRKREPGEFAHEQPGFLRHVITYMMDRLGYSVGQVAKVMVTTEETVRTRYLGESGTKLRTIGAPSRNLIQVPAFRR